MTPFVFLAALFLEQFVPVQGRVVDSKGAAIQGAEVRYRRDLSASPSAYIAEDRGESRGNLMSNTSGRYTAKVHPGVYDVCVMASSYTPACVKVEVSETSHSFPIFQLRTDPLVEKKIRGMFTDQH